MNQVLISNYLRLLRKQHGFTQQDLARELSISRQAVSRWETKGAIPDLDILLELSYLYGITINDILQPDIKKPYIQTFEQILERTPKEIQTIFSNFSKKDIVKASMGASPQAANFLETLLPEIDFKKEQERIGRVKITEIEAIHREIISFLNLSLITIDNL